MTSISWTDETWNPVRGCSRVSEGCRHCYAETMAARIVRMGKGKPTAYDGLVKIRDIDTGGEPNWIGGDGGTRRFAFGVEPRWTGKVAFDAVKLADPLHWKKPRRVFVNSMSDLFHESLTNEQIAAVFGVMAACPQHTFQVLTKRARRMREWFEWIATKGVIREPMRCAIEFLTRGDEYKIAPGAEWPLPNVWLGCSIENQAAADERVPDLLATYAAVRFLSCEPLLGSVDLLPWVQVAKRCWTSDPCAACARNDGTMCRMSTGLPRVDWLIAGCESGPDARSCDVDWLRSLRDQCAAAGVPLFLKQATETKCTCSCCGGRDVATMADYGSMAIWRCGCSPPSPGAVPAVCQGNGSRRKPGGVIELPYLDGVQHAAFPVIR